MDLVSVIIPNYNRAGYVARAIYSVLLQDYPKKEVIVVDDGSSDNSHRVYEMFKGKISVIQHPKNKGVACSRNTGILASKGKYIAFLDSDDYWLSGKLSIQVSYMGFSGLHISQTQEYWIRCGRLVNPNLKNLKRSGDIFGDSLERCYVSPSCVLIRREVFERVGLFREDLRAAEDYELWLRVALNYNIGLIDRPLVVREMGRRWHLSQTSEGIEFWRIMALIGILKRADLSPNRYRMVLCELLKKINIYKTGAQKRGRQFTSRMCAQMAAIIERHLEGTFSG